MREKRCVKCGLKIPSEDYEIFISVKLENGKRRKVPICEGCFSEMLHNLSELILKSKKND